MPALYQNVLWPQADQSLGGRLHVGNRIDLPAGQSGGLGQVRGQQRRQGQYFLLEDLNPSLFQEGRAVAGRQHRINHHYRDRSLAQSCRHHSNNCGSGQHAHFDGIDLDVRQNCFQLRGHQLRGHRPHFLNPGGVLGREGGDDRKSVGAKQSGDPQILLDAGPGTGIRAGDD